MGDISKEVKRTLEYAFGDRSIRSVLNSHVGPDAVRLVDKHTRRGRFLGGRRQNKPYSDAPLPAWYFGKLSFRDGEVIMSSKDPSPGRPKPVSFARMNVTDKIMWRYFDGKAQPLFKGGYRAFRRLTGRSTNRVSLTWSGDLLRGLDYKLSFKPENNAIRVGVYNHRRDVAGWLNKDREFLGLHSDEIMTVARDLVRHITINFAKAP